MSDTEEPDVWRPSHQACHLVVKIQAAANYLGTLRAMAAHGPAAPTNEGDAAFRHLFLRADATWKRCRDLEDKLDRARQTARTLRARLKARARQDA